MHDGQYIRRRKASAYLLEKYGFGAERTLAKGVVTGDTPEFHKAGRIVLYTREALDRWALGKIGEPVRCTSESDAPSKRGRPAGAKPISATLDRAAEAKREAISERDPQSDAPRKPPGKAALGKLSGPVGSTSERDPQNDAPRRRERPAGRPPALKAAEAEQEGA